MGLADIDQSYDPALAGVQLDPITGTLHYVEHGVRERSLTPQVDGSPALKGGTIVRVVQGGDVVAVLVTRAAMPGLYFISVSRAAVLGTFPLSERPGAKPFALSRDGERFARVLEDRRLEVRDVPGDRPPLLVTPRENLWIHFATLGKSCLLVREFDLPGPRRTLSSCLIRWDRGLLEVTFEDANALLDKLGGTVAVSRSAATGNQGRGYDPTRFVQIIEHGALRILIDRYNHLVVSSTGGELLCMFFVSGREFAAWLPDGTMWGSRRYVGGEPAPGASERIAAVMVRASERQGRS